MPRFRSQPAPFVVPDAPGWTVPRRMALATIALLALGAALHLWWVFTGDFSGLAFFYAYPGSVFLVVAVTLGAAWSWQAWRQFAPGDALRGAWLGIALAASCQSLGYILAHWLSRPTYLNPFRAWAVAHSTAAAAVQNAGLEISGTLEMVALAVGLAIVLRAYRRVGLLRRLAAWEWLSAAVLAAYTGRVLYVVARVQTSPSAPPVTLASVLDWLNNPLLAILLMEALLLRRGVAAMRWGLIARCWGSLALAIGLTAAGSVLMWAVDFSYIRWPWSSLTWYAWFPAAAAYALAPAYQLQATAMARRQWARARAARAAS